jgi:hypothetical protein
MTALQPVQNYWELLPETLIESWEERAAIMEYEGGLSREEAEWQAFLCVQGEAKRPASEPRGRRHKPMLGICSPDSEGYVDTPCLRRYPMS